MSRKRKERYPTLKDEHGQWMRCDIPGCRRAARHEHHIVPRCEGGTDDSDNLQRLCWEHHIEAHSAAGDFRKWGQIGGKKAAEHGLSLRNLKPFRDNPERWQEFAKRRGLPTGQ